MPSILFDDFCTTLRTAMDEHGLTGQEVARRSGVHWVTISRILNRQVDNTSFDVADKLLAAAGVTAKLATEKKVEKN